MPQSIEELTFLFPQKAIREKAVAERESYFGRFWIHQLSEINSRLSHLKAKGEQCKVDVETLQHRVTGDLLMVASQIIHYLSCALIAWQGIQSITAAGERLDS
jgi:hypothetical protein